MPCITHICFFICGDVLGYILRLYVAVRSKSKTQKGFKLRQAWWGFKIEPNLNPYYGNSRYGCAVERQLLRLLLWWLNDSIDSTREVFQQVVELTKEYQIPRGIAPLCCQNRLIVALIRLLSKRDGWSRPLDGRVYSLLRRRCSWNKERQTSSISSTSRPNERLFLWSFSWKSQERLPRMTATNRCVAVW